MKRRILLIKGHPKNEKEKDAIDAFGKYYIDYFKSNTGGVYEDSEIINLSSPKVDDIKQLLKTDDDKIDFAIIVLIGHGASQDDKQLFKLNADEIINPGQIELTIKKQLFIVESCRSTASSDFPVVDLTDKIASFKDGGKLKLPITKSKAKELYLAKLESSDDGLVVCFACDEDEKASKFHFTKALIEISKAWSSNLSNDSNVATIHALMVPVAEEVNKLTNKQQAPQIIGDPRFPFAVSRY